MDIRNTEEKIKLASATRVAMETGTILPLLKEELKYLIQSRRLSEGKDEMLISFSVSPPNDELTPRDEQRRERRREQNRLAAQRFREKKRNDVIQLPKLVSELEAQNKKLKEQIQDLTAELISLSRLFNKRLQQYTHCDAAYTLVVNG